MLVPAAGLLIFRGIYLGSGPNNVLPADAAAALFDTLVRFIKEGVRTILVAGLVVVAGAFLTGPSVTAVRVREAFARGLGRVRHGGEQAGLRTGPVGTWTYALQSAAHLRRGPGRASLRVLGPAHRRRRHRDRRPAAGGPRADRADRHAARTAGDDSSPVTPGASRLRSLIHRTYTAPHRESTQAPRIESLVTEVTMGVWSPIGRHPRRPR